MKGYKIDSKNHTVTEIEIGDTWKAIAPAIGCTYFEAACRFDNGPNGGDVLYVDEEGLLKEQHNFFTYAKDGYATDILAGNGLLLGPEPEGDELNVGNLDPVQTLEEFAKGVQFYRTSPSRERSET